MQKSYIHHLDLTFLYRLVFIGIREHRVLRKTFLFYVLLVIETAVSRVFVITGEILAFLSANYREIKQDVFVMVVFTFHQSQAYESLF